MTKWAVLQEHPVTESDLTQEGTVSDEAVERWIDAARQAYLDQCTALRRAREASGLDLMFRTGALPRGELFGRPVSVIVTASAKEFWPDSFRLSVRLRPCGEDRDVPVNVSGVVSLYDGATGEVRELGKEIRDELIALEHSARHFN